MKHCFNSRCSGCCQATSMKVIIYDATLCGRWSDLQLHGDSLCGAGVASPSRRRSIIACCLLYYARLDIGLHIVSTTRRSAVNLEPSRGIMLSSHRLTYCTVLGWCRPISVQSVYRVQSTSVNSERNGSIGCSVTVTVFEVGPLRRLLFTLEADGI